MEDVQKKEEKHALDEAYAILERLERAEREAQRESERIIRHFLHKAEADEVAQMKHRIAQKTSLV